MTLSFRNSVSGDIFVWYTQGTVMRSAGDSNPQNPGSGWKVVAVGDLNGDGHADIVFQHSTSGNVVIVGHALRCASFSRLHQSC